MRRALRTMLLIAIVAAVFAAASASAAPSARFGPGQGWAPKAEDVAGPRILAADDDIPGVALPPSPVAGTLDANAGDLFDIYQVPLEAGQTVFMKMEGEDNTDFDLFLFDSTTTPPILAADDSQVVAESYWGGEDEEIMYTAETAGTYYLVIVHFGDTPGGSYTLEYGYPTNQPMLTANVAKTVVAYGATTTISGSLVDSDSAPMANEYVDLIYKKANGDWTYARSVLTEADGSYSFTVKPAVNTTYQTVFLGDFEYIDALSPARKVYARVSLTTPAAPSSMIANRAVTVTGYLKPRHTAGTYPVRIYRYRWTGSGWAQYGTYVKAKVSNYSSYSKYSASLKLPYKGRWRIRAYHPLDTLHYSTWSTSPNRGFDYITVK